MSEEPTRIAIVWVLDRDGIPVHDEWGEPVTIGIRVNDISEIDVSAYKFKEWF